VRGRLIFPFLIELAQLDTAGTSADPDGAGPMTSGFDADFRETAILPTSDGIGRSARVERTLFKLPGQFYNTDSFLRLQMLATGAAGSTGFTVLFHFRDLEAAGLVETTTGLSKIKVGDRLNAIYTMAGDLVQTIKNPPGAFVTEAQPIFGLGRSRNLLAVTFRSRDPGQG